MIGGDQGARYHGGGLIINRPRQLTGCSLPKSRGRERDEETHQKCAEHSSVSHRHSFNPPDFCRRDNRRWETLIISRAELLKECDSGFARKCAIWNLRCEEGAFRFGAPWVGK